VCTHRGMVSTKLRSAVNVVVIANLPMNSVRRVIVIICKRKNGRFVETEKIRFRQNSGFKPRPGRFCGIDQNWPDFASLIVVVERVNFGLPTIQELHRFLTLRRLRGLILHSDQNTQVRSAWRRTFRGRFLQSFAAVHSSRGRSPSQASNL
jgi:hypothetical protein